MGKVLAEKSAHARQLFLQASEILGFDLLELCTTGPIEKLNRTEFSQPALFVHSYAAFLDVCQLRDGLCDAVKAVAGLSLGEYTAVAAAGGFSFEDGVRLVQIRGRAMQAAAEQVASGMSSIIGLNCDRLREICDAASTESDYVQVANLLCPGNIAISGHCSALERAEKACLEAGAAKAIRLTVAGAFHTAIMQPAVRHLNDGLASIELRETKIPVFSNVDASPHKSPLEIRELLSRQVISPVLWESTLRNLLSEGIDQFIELGSGRVLSGTLKRIDRKASCESLGE